MVWCGLLWCSVSCGVVCGVRVRCSAVQCSGVLSKGGVEWAEE